MFAAGVISNLVDRFIYGGVRDMLPVWGTSVKFNLADAYLLVFLVAAVWVALQPRRGVSDDLP